MATPCPQCGHRNRDGALICSHCSARLGAEPTAGTSFGALGTGRVAPVSPLDDLRVDSDALPLHRATRDAPDRRASHERRERGEGSEARTGWIVAALSFFGVLAAAGAYWWSTEHGPTQTPVPDAAEAAPAAPAPNAQLPPAPTPAPAPVAQTPAPPPAVQAESSVPPPKPAPTPRPAPAPRPASAPPAPPASKLATAAPAAPRTEAPAPRRMAAPEAPRRAPAGEGTRTPGRPSTAAGESDGNVWPPLGREPANTSAPNYSDAGPPIVAGPGPRYQTAPGPTPAPSPASAPAPRPAADPDAIPMPAVTGGDPGRRR